MQVQKSKFGETIMDNIKRKFPVLFSIVIAFFTVIFIYIESYVLGSLFKEEKYAIHIIFIGVLSLILALIIYELLMWQQGKRKNNNESHLPRL
jgi:hypothetical protein